MRPTLPILAAGLVFTLAAGPARAATVRISCSALGRELELCRSEAEAWANRTGNEVQVVTTPNDATERLALYQQVLRSGSDKIDVLQIDAIWPGLLGGQLLDLRPFTGGAERAHFASLVASNTVGGRLVAMPWFTSAGLLYYRRDLLEKYRASVPDTWGELAATARRIQEAERAAGNDRMWGYVWQGRAYEGLTCDALEWVVSHGGGTIIEPDGRVSIRNPSAARALEAAASWVGTISPTAVLNYGEEEARGVFQAGNAVFMRNWPYAWALAQGPDSAVRGKVGVAVLPRGSPGGRHAAVLGGELLAVSRTSKNAALAVDLVLYMTSAQVQKERALQASFNPTIAALYEDPDILAANPFMGKLRGTFTYAVGRPTAAAGTRYDQVSNAFWNAAHEVLSGDATADDALARLDVALRRMARDAAAK